MTVLDMRWKCCRIALAFHTGVIFIGLCYEQAQRTRMVLHWAASEVVLAFDSGCLKRSQRFLVSITILLSINQYLWAQLIIHYWKCFCDRPQFLDRGNTSLNRIFAVGKQERGTIVDCMRLDSSVSISKELTIAYLWFFLTLKKGHKPETSLFFEKIWHFLIFLYRVSPYQLSLDLMKIRTEVIWRWVVGGCCRY